MLLNCEDSTHSAKEVEGIVCPAFNGSEKEDHLVLDDIVSAIRRLKKTKQLELIDYLQNNLNVLVYN